MSLSEDQRNKLAAELLQLLPELFDQEPDARALLASIGRPRSRQAAWHTPAAFWDSELRALLLGVIRDGIPALIVTATNEYFPGNETLLAMGTQVSVLDGEVSEQPPQAREEPPEDQDEPGDAEAKPDLPEARVIDQPAPQFHTLTLVGSERHDDFLRLVRQLVHADAETAYATTAQSGQLPQSAVLISDLGPRAAQVEEQLLAEVRDWGEGITVEYQTSESRPYLLRQIVVSGTDNRRFALRNVPSTTSLSEIARAVLQNYTDDATRARRGRIRTAIDRIGADGRSDRLDSNRTLSDAGVQDGDELRLATEAVAGAGTALWRQSVLRARTQIRRYARDHPGFVIVETDDVQPADAVHGRVPRRWGSRRRPISEARPVNPRLRSEHRVRIGLPAELPGRPAARRVHETRSSTPTCWRPRSASRPGGSPASAR